MSMRTSRGLLEGIGVGHFNATMVIPYLMIAPATTDPKAVQIVVMVRELQKTLFAMGATDVANSGHLDQATGWALQQICGPDWARMSWADNLAAVLDAKATGTRLSPQGALPDGVGMPVAVSGTFDFLPAIPGGLVTYGVLGYLAYRMLTKRRGS